MSIRLTKNNLEFYSKIVRLQRTFGKYTVCSLLSWSPTKLLCLCVQYDTDYIFVYWVRGCCLFPIQPFSRVDCSYTLQPIIQSCCSFPKHLDQTFMQACCLFSANPIIHSCCLFFLF